MHTSQHPPPCMHTDRAHDASPCVRRTRPCTTFPVAFPTLRVREACQMGAPDSSGVAVVSRYQECALDAVGGRRRPRLCVERSGGPAPCHSHACQGIVKMAAGCHGRRRPAASRRPAGVMASARWRALASGPGVAPLRTRARCLRTAGLRDVICTDNNKNKIARLVEVGSKRSSWTRGIRGLAVWLHLQCRTASSGFICAQLEPQRHPSAFCIRSS